MKYALWALGGLVIVGLIFVASQFWPTQTAPTRPTLQTFDNIRIEILNGCGTDGIAKQIGQKLRDLGFDVMTTKNAENFNYPETLVIDRVGKPDYARQVAEMLGTPNQIQQKNPDPFRIEEVTVIIGRDYQRLAIFKTN